MFSKTTIAFVGALAALQGATAQAGNNGTPSSIGAPGASAVPESKTPDKQAAATVTNATERAAWCGTGKPDSTLPCDVVSQLDVAAITTARLNVANVTDRQSREKLVPYYRARLETLKQFKENDKCCRKCKVENRLLTAEQEKYWEKVANDIDAWIEDMKKFESKETDVSPDTAWEHSMKLQTGQPGSALDKEAVSQVPVEQYCPTLAKQALPVPKTNTTQGDQGPPAPIVLPQTPICYKVQAEASVSTNLNGAKFKMDMNLTANAAQTKMAQEVCRAAYFVSTRVNGKIESHIVIGEAVLVAGIEPVPIKPEQEQFVPADCGCDRKAAPIALQDFFKQIFRPEALEQLQGMDLSAESRGGAGFSIFITQTFTIGQGSSAPSTVNGGKGGNAGVQIPSRFGDQNNADNSGSRPTSSSPRVSSTDPNPKAGGVGGGKAEQVATEPVDSC